MFRTLFDEIIDSYILGSLHEITKEAIGNEEKEFRLLESILYDRSMTIMHYLL